MLAAPWRVTITEIDATMSGHPIPVTANTAPAYGCSDLTAGWLDAMDALIGKRTIADVSDREWSRLAQQAEREALAALQPDTMGKC